MLTKDLVFDSKYANEDGTVNTQSAVILTADEFNRVNKEYSDIFKLLASDITANNMVAPELVKCLNSIKTKVNLENNGTSNTYELSFGAILSIMETFDKTLRMVIGTLKQCAINEKQGVNVATPIAATPEVVVPEVVSDGKE